MAQRVQDKKPKRNKAAQGWVDENIAEQKIRYRAIAKEMEDLEPQRKKWYREFLKTIQISSINRWSQIGGSTLPETDEKIPKPQVMWIRFIQRI